MKRVMMRSFVGCALIGAGLFWQVRTEGAEAAAGGERAKKIGELVAPFIDGGWARSVVVGVVDKEGARVYGFGKLSADPASKAPDGKTIFEIASITKTFTALTLAEMAERGELALEDPVAKYLPESVKPPATDQPMTLLRLVTHHSGLPRMPSNFRPADPLNPYADYTFEKLLEFLPKAKVHATAEFEYSNIGFGLLGNALSRRAGKDYEALVIERICAPLGMNDTKIALSDADRKRLAPPFDADLEANFNWDLGGIPGGGALRSTADDMLRYAAAHAGLDLPGAKPPATLVKAIAATHEFRDKASGEQHIALAWLASKDRPLWHNGQTGGYHSFIAFNEKTKIGVVVLCNTASMHIDAIGAGAMRIASGLAPAAVKLPAAIELPAEVLERYAGKYKLPDGAILNVTRDGGRLVTMAGERAPRRIYPKSQTEFFGKAVESTGVFEVDKEGKVTGLLIRQEGTETRAVRVE